MQDSLSALPAIPGAEPAERPVARAAGRPPILDACLRAIERVDQIVEQETLALRAGRRIALSDFNHRKSHGLLELTRAFRSLGDPARRRELEPMLRGLRSRLGENAATLRMHLQAVQEVSSVMAKAIRDGESDGTYSAALRAPRAGQ